MVVWCSRKLGHAVFTRYPWFLIAIVLSPLKKTSENTLPPSGKQIERQRRREEGRDSRYGGGIFESCCWSEEDEQGGSRTGRSESQLAKTQPVKNWIDLQ